MKRRPTDISYVIGKRSPRLQAATDRAIAAVMGKRVKVREPFPKQGEVDEVFRAARRGET